MRELGTLQSVKKNYLQMLNRQRQENDSPWQRHGITKEVRKYDYENSFYV